MAADAAKEPETATNRSAVARETVMEPVFYVMAILGCGDGSSQCTTARIEPAHYASVQQCQAALPLALERNTDLSFPTIAANCRASGPVMVRNEAGQPSRG